MTERPAIRSLTVLGPPTPQGSMKWIPRGGAEGGVPLIIHSNQTAITTYREAVRFAWNTAPTRIPEVPTGPLELTVTFFFARPQSHYKRPTKKRPRPVLRVDADTYVNKRPDLDKLLRAVGDALEGLAWADDKQVVKISATKEWGETSYTLITVAPAPLIGPLDG